MKLLFITTKEFYFFSQCKQWEEVECPSINLLIDRWINAEENEYRIQEFFFIQGECREDQPILNYWNTEDRKQLSLLKRQCNGWVLYALPCIPKCHEHITQLERQNYLGIALETALENCNDFPEEILLATHDRDVIEDNGERIVQTDDIVQGSQLDLLIKSMKISVSNIYAFQHSTNICNRMFMHIRDLSRDEIPRNTLQDIYIVFHDAPCSNKSTEHTNPITLTFKVDENGNILIKEQSFEIPSDYNNDTVHLIKCKNLIKNIINNRFRFPRTKPGLQGGYHAYVFLHDEDELEKPSSEKQHNKFGQNIYANRELDKEFYPCIHFCPIDLLNEKAVNNRYAYVMNNSIWNYYIQTDKENTEIELSSVLTTIAENTNRGLYSLYVAKEYAELNARMTLESYIKPSPGNEGHYQDVVPFIFHSEKKIDGFIKDEFEGKRQTIEEIKHQKWRILLVDDRSTKPMGPVIPNPNDSFWNTKLKIIKNLIEDRFSIKIECRSCKYENIKNDNVKNSPQTNILIEYAENIEDAEDALTKREYEIILLDYLLKEDGKPNRYGYELLDSIYNQVDGNHNRKVNKTSLYKIGPRGKYFFMFISAYSSAIYERLQAEGLNQDEKYWRISVGACPTNTPKLFLYNLIKLMERRLDTSDINKLSLKQLYDLTYNIFNSENVRKTANEEYRNILSLQYYYRNILEDVAIPTEKEENDFNTSGSVLMTNFVKSNIHLGGLLEHLAQLIHLIAFGTVRQWPEMWEEYIYVKAQLDMQHRIDSKDVVSDKDMKKLFNIIESYILTMKSSAI